MENVKIIELVKKVSKANKLLETFTRKIVVKINKIFCINIFMIFLLY